MLRLIFESLKIKLWKVDKATSFNLSQNKKIDRISFYLSRSSASTRWPLNFLNSGQVDSVDGGDEEGSLAAAVGSPAGEGSSEGPQDRAGEPAQRSQVAEAGGQRPADPRVDQEDPVAAAETHRPEGGPGRPGAELAGEGPAVGRVEAEPGEAAERRYR